MPSKKLLAIKQMKLRIYWRSTVRIQRLLEKIKKVKSLKQEGNAFYTVTEDIAITSKRISNQLKAIMRSH